jgi:hypothetical protein
MNDRPWNSGPGSDARPNLERAVLVQGEGFRCLAFQDREGRWRNYFNRELLHGAIRILNGDPATDRNSEGDSRQSGC